MTVMGEGVEGVSIDYLAGYNSIQLSHSLIDSSYMTKSVTVILFSVKLVCSQLCDEWKNVGRETQTS